MTIWNCPSSATLFHSQSWWSVSFCHPITSFMYPHRSIAMFQRMTIWKCPLGTSFFHRQSWWCASFRHSFKSSQVITSFRSHNHVSEGKLKCQYKDVLQAHLYSQLLLKFTWIMIVFEQYCPQYDLNMLVHWLSFFEPHCPQFTDSSFNHLSLPPS
jgi:hypothetical protein